MSKHALVARTLTESSKLSKALDHILFVFGAYQCGCSANNPRMTATAQDLERTRSNGCEKPVFCHPSEYRVACLCVDMESYRI